jgi:hypothetical protein
MALLRISTLVEKLGATVGDAKASQAVQSAVDALGADGLMALNQPQVIRLLDVIAGQEGVTGLAARLLRIRAEFAFDALVKEER